MTGGDRSRSRNVASNVIDLLALIATACLLGALCGLAGCATPEVQRRPTIVGARGESQVHLLARVVAEACTDSEEGEAAVLRAEAVLAECLPAQPYSTCLYLACGAAPKEPRACLRTLEWTRLERGQR